MCSGTLGLNRTTILNNYCQSSRTDTNQNQFCSHTGNHFRRLLSVFVGYSTFLLYSITYVKNQEYQQLALIFFVTLKAFYLFNTYESKANIYDILKFNSALTKLNILKTCFSGVKIHAYAISAPSHSIRFNSPSVRQVFQHRKCSDPFHKETCTTHTGLKNL